ncbi:hypothetical protein [Hymenobacter terrenus]|uniref:hypothetical protein n=1 Tax=Hymenobacter terrenus TaxID=1629124 RepID=UPI00061A0AAF|nr:hypothetical protein [Hymenobacter terrenus]
MKNSLKFLTAAGLLLLGSLTAYNAALHTEYTRGSYRDTQASRSRDYTKLALNNFTKVAVPAAAVISVKIMPGPYEVWVKKEAAEFVHITQQGQQLTVAVALPEAQKNLAASETVLIQCPRLSSLTTDGVYTIAGKPQANKTNSRGRVVVQGFVQDSLTMRQDRASSVQLENNKLGYLRAVAGASLGSGSTLKVSKENAIEAADLAIEHQSRLELGSAIPKLHYQFSDSATAVFSGGGARSLNGAVR